MENKLNLPYPIVVEGKYDKIKLSAVVTSPILVCNGFSVFNDEKNKMHLKTMCKNGCIILTDSDKAGSFIRSRLKDIIKSDNMINLYTPVIKGKEKRKKEESKEGTLGVEGIDSKVLYDLLKPYSALVERKNKIKKSDLFALGLSGCEGSTEKRNAIAKKLELPKDLTPNAFLDAVNVLIDLDRLKELMNE